ncbi:hypothetical protein [uncultured Anaerococcus sp.]|uniref:hypothetical protein n=1 Tax=uncultured Anaerococcus sp. TaxID=293428 RepID=UPI002622CFB4|nr:hypothetical protein [uncultured Anaerococcus sp.]
MEFFQENNYKNLIKSIISMELDIDDEMLLDKIYDFYMDNDDISLISEEINRFVI